MSDSDLSERIRAALDEQFSYLLDETGHNVTQKVADLAARVATEAEQQSTCIAGPEGCDPRGGELVRCVECDEPACDFHGDYADAAAHAAGEWLCPNHQEVSRAA